MTRTNTLYRTSVAFILVLMFAGFAVAATLSSGLTPINRILTVTSTTVRQTTTTLKPSIQPVNTQLYVVGTTSTTVSTLRRCEAVENPSSNACSAAYCPNNQRCQYKVVVDASGAQTGKCSCSQDTTTTLPQQEVRCEAVVNANVKTCMKGICPQGYDCGYVSSTAAANVGYCKCQLSATTTTLPVRCEAVGNANEKTCMNGICPQGYDCRYVSVLGAAPYCKCQPSVTTTTLSTQVRCEAVGNANEKTCMNGICPQGYDCRYVSVLGAAPYCKCQPSVTTTTLQYTWCEDITNPTEGMCLRGLCPPNTVCRLRSGVSRISTLSGAGANAGVGCVCVPCESYTTTTLPIRCAAVQYPSSNTCSIGVCPQGTRCRYKPGPSSSNLAAAAPQGTCECVSYTTTTTLPIRCEAVQYPSPNTCSIGLCPTNMACVYKPGAVTTNYLAAMQSSASCVCVTTTTTLPTQVKCEAMEYSSANTCVEGLCPPDYECRYVPLVSAANVGQCRCVIKSTTTTTLQGQVKCEGMVGASANTCVQGICLRDYKCRYVPSPTAANTGSCVCIPPTTTTLPGQVRCEAIEKANVKTCVEGLCPQDSVCRFVASAAAANAGSCMCIQSTTTTQPSQVRCEAMTDASQKVCVDGLCPPEHKCRFVPSAAAANVGYCKCVLDETPTTVPQRDCGDITNPSANTCVEGSCPPNQVCRLFTDDSGAAKCACVSTTASTAGEQTTTTLRQGEQKGFTQRIMDMLFGWMG